MGFTGDVNCPSCGYALSPFETDCPKCALAKTRPQTAPIAVKAAVQAPPTTPQWVPSSPAISEPIDSGLWDQWPFRFGIFMAAFGFIGFRLMWSYMWKFSPNQNFQNPTAGIAAFVLINSGLLFVGAAGVLMILVGVLLSMIGIRRRAEG
ncbi:hypothetical protein EON80_20975 [bacterium]|nr:MAG: hypothetical protein EON80_20975 [bacterium]